MSHADDTTPDPLKMPLDDLSGTMSLGEEPVAAGSARLGESDPLAVMFGGEAAAEPVAEPTDAKSKKQAEKERKKREQEEKKRKAREAKEAKAKAKQEKRGKKKEKVQEEGEMGEPEAEPDEATEEVKGKKSKREKKGRKQKEAVAAEGAAEFEAAAKPPLLPWLTTRLRRASPYTVMLAVGFGSLAVAVSFLVLYLSKYQFKIRP